MTWGCRHKWEVKVNERIPAPITVWDKTGCSSVTGFHPIDAEDMGKETVLVVMVCAVCGKVREIRS